MRFRSTMLFLLALVALAMPARAQSITDQSLDLLTKGLEAERDELDKVGDKLKELDDKIAKFRECAGVLQEAGGGKTGLAAKVAMKAKCGATSEDGMQKDKAKLYEQPEKVGASAAGMKQGDYAKFKERIMYYLRGERSGYGTVELASLDKRKSNLEKLFGMTALAANNNDNGGGGRNGGGRNNGGGMIGRAVGGMVAGQMQAMTTQMTWIFVQYLWGMLYMSGATMFETPYQPGQWTQWTITDESKPDEKMMLERALLKREADGSEWWRLKTISQGRESSDTIVMESQMKKLDEAGLTMQVVRMRGKFPGDSVGKEMMVPENMSMLSAGAFQMKPTKESLAGATVGTDNIRVGGTTYSAKHVKFSAGTGDMNWWISEKAPGGLVKTMFSGQGEGQKWTMELTASGSGAKSELGLK